VCDYEITCATDTGWQELCTITDNHQRQRRHHLGNPIHTQSLRITVTRAHGIDQARILEVRAYAGSDTGIAES
jgi:hypothetical protein